MTAVLQNIFAALQLRARFFEPAVCRFRTNTLCFVSHISLKIYASKSSTRNKSCFFAATLLATAVYATPESPAQQFPYKNCRIDSREKAKVASALTFRVEAPSLSAQEWIYYAPYPPELPAQQTLTGSEFFVDDKPFKCVLQKESSPLARPLLLARIPALDAGLRKGLDARCHYFLTLSTKTLVESKDNLGQEMKDPPSKDKLAKFLQTSKSLDFQTESFRTWLAEHGLKRRAEERDLDFAWRTFLEIRRTHKYFFDPNRDLRASVVCRKDNSDCGGLSFLFVAALRANSIPARALVGRWLKAEPGQDSPQNGYGQVHVKAEFFADKVGWVPVDMSLAVSNKSGIALDYFGKFDGNFVTFHLDPDLLIDSFWFGSHEIPVMQSPLYWVTGAGSLAGKEEMKVWQTRK